MVGSSLVTTSNGAVLSMPPEPDALEIVTTGSVVSTTQLWDAGVPSWFPAASRDRTWNECGPSPTEKLSPLSHVEKEPTSILHSKVMPPEEGAGSSASKVKVEIGR